MRVSTLSVTAGAIAILAFGVTSPAASQNAPLRPNARRAQMMAHPLLGPLAKALPRLDLTPTQKEQVKGFVETAQADAKAVREDTSLKPEQKREKMRAITAKLRESILGILTPEQKAELRKAMQAPTVQRPMVARWLVLMQRLDLTEAQKAEVKKLVQAAREKEKDVRESNLMPVEKRLKVQEIENDLHQKILKLLTPEQKQKLQRLLAAAPPMRPNPKR